jgi:hypothetical protein
MTLEETITSIENSILKDTILFRHVKATIARLKLLLVQTKNDEILTARVEGIALALLTLFPDSEYKAELLEIANI